jgi:DNA-binding response OmpR family regulator
MEKKCVLLVDKNKRNSELISNLLKSESIDTISSCDYNEFDEALTFNRAFHLALIDVAGFDVNIWERCKILQEKQIPFIILSDKQSFVLQEQGMAHGAKGLIHKPVVIKHFLTLIQNMLNG